ncbi:hypothetical protein AB0G85_37320 [Streptomyces sioyaensis]|uniref:hypothetical protein n=1 Tax=Streptomyces sioyaensis TaxID=67364 RepID=UPI0033C1CA38
MSHFHIQYAGGAEASRKAMDPAVRSTVEKTLGVDPYGHGSTDLTGDADYREATIADCFVVYYVSAPVLTITVVRIVH